MKSTPDAPRVALYARFSSEMQNARSIDDQIALCEAAAAREGGRVVARYDDRARSGASLFNRPGLARAMADAKAGLFDVLLVESLDRVSRDQEDLAGTFKRLTFAGVELRAVHEGRADAIQVGVRGLLGQLFLKDLAQKVHRGMAGVIRDGRHAGGRAYGYRPMPGQPGALAIVEAEAEIVRRVFAEFLGGRAPRDIAAGLNRDGAPPPRGALWNASTINGSRARRNGILFNELYAGRLVWNRVRMVKDPETGRRVSRPNPPAEWRRAECPGLAIVTPDVFERARARREAKTHRGGAGPKQRRLLTGKLKCGLCGGGMSVVDHTGGRARIACSRRRESGTCDNARKFNLVKIERRVIDSLRGELESPEEVQAFVAEYAAELRRLAAAARRDPEAAARKLRAAEDRMARLADAIAEGAPYAAFRARVEACEAECAALRAEIESAREAPAALELHPGAAKGYATRLADLHLALTSDANVRPDMRDSVADIIRKVVVTPAEPEGAALEIEMDMGPMLGEGGNRVAGARYLNAPLVFRLRTGTGG